MNPRWSSVSILAFASVLAACSDDTVLARLSDAGVPETGRFVSLEAATHDGTPPPPPPPGIDGAIPTYCNGEEALCDRPYDQIAFFGTHRSAAFGNPPWKAPTQGRAITGQFLTGGVRFFEIDVRTSGGVLAVCADSCADGSASLSSVLRDFSGFLRNFPGDVLTLLVRSLVPASELAGAFDSAGLSALAHVQDPTAKWPTLRQMTTANHRLVVFLDDSRRSAPDGGPPSDSSTREGGLLGDASPDTTIEAGSDGGGRTFFHHHSQWIWETSQDVGAECIPSAGSARNPMILVNHYATGPRPTDAELLAQHNPDRVAARLQRCLEDRGQLPTFVLVDFAEIGDANGGVQIANGLR